MMIGPAEDNLLIEDADGVAEGSCNWVLLGPDDKVALVPADSPLLGDSNSLGVTNKDEL